MPTKILIAPDSFKSSLSSMKIGDIIGNALMGSGLSLLINIQQLADGGEGSLAAIGQNSNFRTIQVIVDNPLFKQVNTRYLFDESSNTAYIELAQASGITLVENNPDIMNSSSFGTGSLIKHAIMEGAERIVLFVGGSATNDAGLGILNALGFRFTNKLGNIVNPLPSNILEINNIDVSQSILQSKDIEIIVASDVENPFFGNNGAAYIYAPQKGASNQEIELLDKSLQHLAKLFLENYNIDIQKIIGSGAAGGVAGGLYVLANAKIVRGADFLFDILGIEQKVKDADIIISGEGKIDNQSLNNKLLFALSKLVKKHNKKLWAICGYFDGDNSLLQKMKIDKLFSFTDKKHEIKASIINAESRLLDVSHQILQELKKDKVVQKQKDTQNK